MKQFGKQKPRYKFILNPYVDVRCTRCPRCEGLTRLRKFVLAILVKPRGALALNKTCRFCSGCEILIAHQDELEAQLAIAFPEQRPEAEHGDFLVVGTIDRADWKKGFTIAELPEKVHEFKQHLELHVTGGWQPSPEAAARLAATKGPAGMPPPNTPHENAPR
jgi:hypothetical protein